jgi:hypothetical protein
MALDGLRLTEANMKLYRIALLFTLFFLFVPNGVNAALTMKGMDTNYSFTRGSLIVFPFTNIPKQTKPKLGRGTFTGTLKLVFREGDRVTGFYVDAGIYRLDLNSRSAVITGGNLSEGVRVRVTYKNLKNSEQDIGRWFTGDAVRVVVLKERTQQLNFVAHEEEK